MQGDLPTVEPETSSAPPRGLLDDSSCRYRSRCAPPKFADRHENEAIPTSSRLSASAVGRATPARALFHPRQRAAWGDGPLYHHIGLYAYRRAALVRFVGLPPGELETREKLEQLRALEAGMRIDAVIVDDLPLGVDTPADLERARALLAARRLN